MTPRDGTATRAGLLRATAVAVVLFSLASMTVAAWQQDWTYDEPFHLDYARQLLARRPPGRDSVFNSKTPALLPHVLLEEASRAVGITDAPRLKFVARLPSVVLYLVLLAAIFRFTSEHATRAAGWVAVLAAALDPNLAAHSGLAAVDAMFALAMFLTLWAMIGFARTGRLSAAVWLGLALGFSLAVKFTGVFLAPAFVSLLVVGSDGGRLTRHDVLRRAERLSIAALVSCVVISISYLFVEFGKPFASFHFETGALKAIAHAAGWLRLPLPGPFLTGLDMVAHLERTQAFNVIILDHWYDDGVWYYFLVLAWLKTPLTLIAGVAAGLVLGLRGAVYRRLGLGLVVLQLAFFIVYFSFLFRGQNGYRYLLMVLPWCYVLAAIGLKNVLSRASVRSAVAAAAAIALLELLPFFGHPLAFTNAIVHPKRDAFKYVADSNLYWNEYHDQVSSLVSKSGRTVALVNPIHILPGTVVYDATTLSGILWSFSQHLWVRRNLRTVDHIRHVLFVYEVSEDDFDWFLESSRKVRPLAERSGCPELPHQRLDGSIGVPASARLCVDALEASDIALSATWGSAYVGVETLDGRCSAEPLAASQEIWYRLETGQHILCVTGRHEFRGEWRVRRGHALFRTE